MSITVSDMMQMEPFSRFRLLAGMNGIERSISTVNILDYEYSENFQRDPDAKYFEENALILTTLMFAKGNPGLLVNLLDHLMKEKVSALAIKSTFFDTLPDVVIEKANEHSFPIFLFGERDGCFEDIISYLMEEIRKRDDDRHLEHNLILLMNDPLPRPEVQKLALECVPRLKPPYQILALFPENPSAISWTTARNANRTYRTNILLYLKTVFIVIMKSENSDTDGHKTRQTAGLPFVFGTPSAIGHGNTHSRIDEFDYALKEALYACDFAERTKTKSANFNEMGIMRVLYPYHTDYWMHSYCREILQTIQDYDSRYHTEFLNTAVAFINADADFAKTARLLHVHKNTVHYRINRLNELLGTETTLNYYEQLLLIVRYYEFYEKL